MIDSWRGHLQFHGPIEAPRSLRCCVTVLRSDTIGRLLFVSGRGAGGWGGGGVEASPKIAASKTRVSSSRVLCRRRVRRPCRRVGQSARGTGYGAPTRRPFAVITAIINSSGGRRKPRRVMPEMPPMGGGGGGGAWRTVRGEGGGRTDGDKSPICSPFTRLANGGKEERMREGEGEVKENDRRKGRGKRERQRELTKVSARCAEEEEPREGNSHHEGCGFESPGGGRV